MGTICSSCGLPKDICVCQEIAKGGQKIKIRGERRKFKKLYTVVEGFDESTDIVQLAREFKHKLACGGTAKEGRIELQGNHLKKVKEMLLKMNYNEDQIDVC
ncbi:MAG: stress response translation initiation inhibitor YciH [Candidatus Micrarchaeota archaeon]